ncbi:hypothetical protein CH54_1528 [Yersinia rochesterensis]|uniref:DUF3987 domain-containing protein n=1 Tax=Yersinia rochesterensis TaxID=1604335 RepID=A0ABN4FIQ3_9GAMM|nr:YfjI family protein [Yersinia rochesterensis]AJI85622.1 hypothetical protein AW19_135 [Yersinia frederiksenii Y225]AJJ37256.1 hypothetical protein CH54_1528 [Yersinia rochesterensis]
MMQLPSAPAFQQQQWAPIPTFPTHAFPPVIQNAMNVLQDGGKFPPELVASAVFAAVSLACQSHVDVLNPCTNMPEPSALFLMTLAESGMGKSTISKQAMKPFYTFKTQLAIEYQETLFAYKRDHGIWKTIQQALESNLRAAVKKGVCGDEEQTELEQHSAIEPAKPVAPVLVYSDSSLAALIEGLSQYSSAGLISDEAIIFFESSIKDNPGFFNKAWDGDVYEHNRSHREPRSFKPTLTLSLMLQPAIFLDYMNKHGDKAKASGFLSRFLFTKVAYPLNNHCPSLSTGHRHSHHSFARDETALHHFHARIQTLLVKQKEQISSGNTEKKTLTLSAEAAVSWEHKRGNWTFLAVQGQKWSCIHEMVQKANANTLRVAALLHYFSSQEADTISLDTLERASTIMEWYLNHAASFFYQFTPEYKFQQDANELYQWVYQKFVSNGGIPFKKNDVIKYGPNKFRRSEKLEPLLNSIISTGNISYAKSSPHSAVYITWRMANGYYAPIIEHLTGTYSLPQQDPK